MAHNFNYTKVRFLKEESKDINTNVVLYHVENGIIICNQENYVSNLLMSLPKKDGAVTSFISGAIKTIYVCIDKNKNLEKSIVNVLKNILSEETTALIQVFAKSYNFDCKKLVSKIMFDTKNEWSLKTKNKDLFCKSVTFVVEQEVDNIVSGEALAETQSFVQQLVNMPANHLTPLKFIREANRFIANNQLTSKIDTHMFDKNYLRAQEMNSFLSVAKGSAEDPFLMVLKYNNAPSDDKPIVLVGKGLTFDAGGISLKPSTGMDAMKTDMAGAATAVGAICYAAKMNLPINMVVVVALCENMPDGNAVKPGDVITAMNGTTIEVVDTDAEGRLVLADALFYSKQFDGRYTIDMATLTGACIVALGHVHTGLFTKDEELAAKLLKAGIESDDLVWQLPLTVEHEEMLESKVADISNLCLGKGAGAQNGAVFLQKFAPETGWCHLDIAGTSNLKGSGATSRPLAMLSLFLDSFKA